MFERIDIRYSFKWFDFLFMMDKTAQIISEVRGHVETMPPLLTNPFSHGVFGFIVYDNLPDQKGTDFYAKVVVNRNTVLLLITHEFAKPLITSSNSDDVTIRDPSNGMELKGRYETWLEDLYVVFEFGHYTSTPMLCSAIIQAAYGHRKVVQAMLWAGYDTEIE
jgi:hypothetical protein